MWRTWLDVSRTQRRYEYGKCYLSTEQSSRQRNEQIDIYTYVHSKQAA